MDMPISESVSSREFVRAMTARWISLGNISSSRLEALWGVMADTFNTAIAGNSRFIADSTWRVLEPPTGSGKTQGVCVYAALAMQRNVSAAYPLGMLIVTRTKDQADEIVSTIRELVANTAPGRSVVAKHSGNVTSSVVAQHADVLVICHEAYTRALEANRWQDYVEWAGGRRSLTVIDEALTGIIDEQQVKASDVQKALGSLSATEQAKFPSQVAALRQVQLLLERIGNSSADGTNEAPKMSIAWKTWDGPDVPDMSELRARLATKRYDLTWLGRADSAQRKEMADSVDEAVKGCEALLQSWAYYAKHYGNHTLNTAKLIVPAGLPGVVVLDATASSNFLWTLLDDHAVKVPIPTNTRSYSRVTLHVARTSSGLGKRAMSENASGRVNGALKAVEGIVGSDRKVFLVCHKDVAATAVDLQTNFTAYDVGWYGAIDGKNRWNDFDTAIILGMYRLPDTWSRNAFMALQGIQDDEWLNSPARWKDYTDVRLEMERRQLTVSIVQAVNRVRCRRVVDADGNCRPTDLFIVLREGDEGDAILANVVDEMPGVQVEPWEFELDAPAERFRKGSSHAGLVVLLRGGPPRRLSMASVRSSLGLTENGLKSLKKALGNPAHALSKAVSELGYAFVVEGRGRGPGSKAYLQPKSCR